MRNDDVGGVGDYSEVVFRFPDYTETKAVKLGVKSQEQKGFPPVLNIKIVSEADRRAEILRANPAMYIPKTLV